MVRTFPKHPIKNEGRQNGNGGCRHDFPLVIFPNKVHSWSLARPSTTRRAAKDKIYLLLPERGSAYFSMNPWQPLSCAPESWRNIHFLTSVISVLFLTSTARQRAGEGLWFCAKENDTGWRGMPPVGRVRGFWRLLSLSKEKESSSCHQAGLLGWDLLLRRFFSGTIS